MRQDFSTNRERAKYPFPIKQWPCCPVCVYSGWAGRGPAKILELLHQSAGEAKERGGGDRAADGGGAEGGLGPARPAETGRAWGEEPTDGGSDGDQKPADSAQTWGNFAFYFMAQYNKENRLWKSHWIPEVFLFVLQWAWTWKSRLSWWERRMNWTDWWQKWSWKMKRRKDGMPTRVATRILSVTSNIYHLFWPLNSSLGTLNSSLVSDPAVRGRSVRHIRLTFALRSSCRSSFAVRKELRLRGSIDRGRWRRSCTDGGRMSFCPDLSRNPATAGIRSDKRRIQWRLHDPFQCSLMQWTNPHMSVYDEVILNKLNTAQAKCLSFSLFYFLKSPSVLPYILKKNATDAG